MNPSQKQPLLGGLSAHAFMRTHWQRAPHLVRNAVVNELPTLGRAELFALAGRDDVESRLIVREAGQWQVDYGPFKARTLRALPATDWTLLVQGVNVHVPSVDQLLQRFRFIPEARLDDVMISYAVPGGGVGPHFDSYDVFLLQGQGEREWRWGAQADLSLVPDLPLKILKRFKPDQRALLGPGDMLYLPPAQAHDGIAKTECTTYSIGFRAPSHQAWIAGFLDYLHEHLEPTSAFADPGLAATARPGRIPKSYVSEATRLLQSIRWTRADIERFAGLIASELKADVLFEPPLPALSLRAFVRATQKGGVRLHPAARLLYDDQTAYLNGERLDPATDEREMVERLADQRSLGATECDGFKTASLHLLYLDGIVLL